MKTDLFIFRGTLEPQYMPECLISKEETVVNSKRLSQKVPITFILKSGESHAKKVASSNGFLLSRNAE